MPTATAKTARPWETGKAAGAPVATLPEAKAPATAPETATAPVLKIERPKTVKPHLADLYDMTAGQLIDALAKAQAELSAVKKTADREEEIKKLLKPLGAGEFKGGKCMAEIVVTATKTLDTDKVKAIIPEDKLDSFYKHGTQTKIIIKPLV